LVALAKDEPSALVRLYIACVLPSLPAEQRWSVAGQLVQHAEDADDANLPRIVWYAIEPLVANDHAAAIGLLQLSRWPLLRRNLARRLVESR
jgi:hypothetical protein